MWIGERFDTKDLPSLAGAIGQVTERVRIGAAVTVPGVRHPMVLASDGPDAAGRSPANGSALGFGRSAAWRWRQYGVPAPTLASFGDTADILRRLWAGETVTYAGPPASSPELRLAHVLTSCRRDSCSPPWAPKTLALAGRAFDGVILHPFLTEDAVRRSVGVVHEAALDAGRDPAQVRCYATVVVAPDPDRRRRRPRRRRPRRGLPPGARVGRRPRRRQRVEPRRPGALRALPKLAALGERAADKSLDRDELVELSRALPTDWLPSSSVVGDAATCAARLRGYLDAGADELVLHGSTAEHLGDLADAFTAGVHA